MSEHVSISVGEVTVEVDVDAPGRADSNDSLSTCAVSACAVLERSDAAISAVDGPVLVLSGNSEGASLGAVTVGLTSGGTGSPATGDVVALADEADGTSPEPSSPGNEPNESRSREHATRLLELTANATQRFAVSGFLQGTFRFCHEHGNPAIAADTKIAGCSAGDRQFGPFHQTHRAYGLRYLRGFAGCTHRSPRRDARARSPHTMLRRRSRSPPEQRPR